MARRAFLVATDRYSDPTFAALGAPAEDAEALAALLRDPRFGAFDEVEVVRNGSAGEVAEALEQHYATAEPSDTLLVYLTGHGVRDRFGKLYFAMPNTRADRLLSTGLPAAFLHSLMDGGPRQQVVVLDCCYSGAFVQGMTPKGADAGVTDALPAGRGQVVLAASTRVQYAFEQDSPEGPSSVYTRALVDGIRSGAADVDGDGLVTSEEAHAHAARRLRELGQAQQPQRWTFGLGGDIVLARAGNDVPLALPAAPSPRRRVPVLALLLGLLLLLGAAATWVWWPEPPPTPAVGTYQVELTGTAANGGAIDSRGELRIAATDEPAAPYRICLKVGFPAGDPKPGSIWFGTTPACFGSDAPGPLVDQRVEDREMVLTPRAHGLDQTAAMWQFSITSGLTSCWYVPDSGEVRLTPSGTTLAGVVNLRGLDSCGSSAQGTFTAELSATRVSADPNASISTPPLPVEVGGPAAPGVTGARYGVSTIRSLELTEGRLAWLDSVRRKVNGAVLVLDRPNGRFEWALPDTTAELYPLRGTVTEDPAGVLVLTATSSHDYGVTGTTTVTWSGTLDPRGAEPLLEFTTAISAPVTQNTEAYRASVLLRSA